MLLYTDICVCMLTYNPLQLYENICQKSFPFKTKFNLNICISSRLL